MISKPLAQQILCLSHRGSATTLSVVLNSYLFAVSASAITAFLSLITWQSPIPLTRHMETTQFLLPVSVRVQPFTVRISCYFPDICIQLFAFFLRQRWRQGIPLKAHRLPATMHVSRSSKEVKLCFPASLLHITHIFLSIIVNLFSPSWFSLCFPKSYSDHCFLPGSIQNPPSSSLRPNTEGAFEQWKIVPDSFKTFPGLSGAFDTTVSAVPSDRESCIVRDLQLVTCSELVSLGSARAEEHRSYRAAVSSW